MNITESKRIYNTRQKQSILDCLMEREGEHVSADTIRLSLLNKGTSVGLTTVYRNLDKLVEQGVAIKYHAAEGGSASYQYVGDTSEHCGHYHLVCLDCGDMVHLHCNIIDDFSKHIKEIHDFSLDSLKTVFYGYCASCKAAGKEKPQ